MKPPPTDECGHDRHWACPASATVRCGCHCHRGVPVSYRLTAKRLIHGDHIDQAPLEVAPAHLSDVVRAEMNETRHPLLELCVVALGATGRPL